MKKVFSRSIIILIVITIFTTSIGQNVNLAYANTTNSDSKICIESPSNSKVVKGIVKIEGYVLSDFDPSTLGFLNCNVNVDGINQNDTLFKLKTAIQRDDLKKLFPSYTYAGTGGFSYELDTTKLTNGIHKIKLDFNGIKKDIELTVNNNPSLINVEIPTNEIVKGITEIKGYILSDLSPSTFNFMNCEIYVDGNLQDNTLYKLKTAIQRDDLIKKYPSYEYAGTGGFCYKLDTTKLTNGSHKIKLNFNGIEKDIEINVYNNPSLVNIEFPIMENVRGIIDINGYILSDLSPSTFNFMNCNVYIDGINQNDTFYNLKTAIERVDLKDKYSGYEYAGTGGFSYKLDTTKLTNGNHTARFDFNGIEKEIEIKVFNNPTNTESTAVDKVKEIVNIESLTDDLKGIATIEGYILSDNNPSIFDSMHCRVYIDGEIQSIYDLKTGIERKDLKGNYPDYEYAETGGFSYKLDTVKLNNGVHILKLDFNGIVKEQKFVVNNYNQTLVLDKFDTTKIQGFMKITGYAITSYSNLSSSDYSIYIDDNEISNFYFDFKSDLSREELKNKYPYCNNLKNCGFKYIFDTRLLQDGKHKITIKCKKNIESTLEFTVDNSNYNRELDTNSEVTYEESFNVMNKQINIITEDTTSQLKKMNSKMEAMYSEVSKEINTAIEESDTATNKINAGFKEMNTAIEKINSNFKLMIAILDEMNSAVDEMNASMNVMITSSKEMINAQNKMINAQNEMIKILADSNTTLDEMNNACNEMLDGMDKINETDLVNQLNEIMLIIQRLQTFLNNQDAYFQVTNIQYTPQYDKIFESFNNKIVNYISTAVEHIVYGNYTNKINILGVGGDIVLGVFDVDLPGDLRDVSYDVSHWEWSWNNAAEIAMDGIGLLPVVGVIKYGDKIGLLVKDGEKSVKTVKIKDTLEEILQDSEKENNLIIKNGEKVISEGGSKLVKSADDVIFQQSSIDKAFTKHSADFGNYADGSKESLEQFKKDISELINNGIQKSGTWKGVEGTHIYNSVTKQWTFINADGTFNTAFKLSDSQFKYLIESGVVK